MLTSGNVARLALRGVLFLLLANCIAAQIAISDCQATDCEGSMEVDGAGSPKTQCCAYLRINDQNCCSPAENDTRELYFGLIIGLAVAVFALIVIVLVIVCICVCCCCC